jgi:hypothetical protein
MTQQHEPTKKEGPRAACIKVLARSLMVRTHLSADRILLRGVSTGGLHLSIPCGSDHDFTWKLRNSVPTLSLREHDVLSQSYS